MTLQKLNSVALDCCGCAPATQDLGFCLRRWNRRVAGSKTGRVGCTWATEKSSQRNWMHAGSHDGQSEMNSRPFCCLQWDLLLGLAHMTQVFTTEPQTEMSCFGAWRLQVTWLRQSTVKRRGKLTGTTDEETGREWLRPERKIVKGTWQLRAEGKHNGHHYVQPHFSVL